ncbi:MAG: hypothetical protein IJM23_03995 [Lachnospiraceae bacterium]|nr:hypothetical protein [Lachnospiraceae bacterium]
MDGFDNNNNNGTGFTQPEGTQAGSTQADTTPVNNVQPESTQTGTGYSQPNNSFNTQNNYDTQNTYNPQNNWNSSNSWDMSDGVDEEDYLKRQNKWFVISIIDTVISIVCCCNMFGVGMIAAIVGLVCSITSKNAYRDGDMTRAESQLKVSKIANIVFFVFLGLAILGNIVYYLLYGAAIGASMFEQYLPSQY